MSASVRPLPPALRRSAALALALVAVLSPGTVSPALATPGNAGPAPASTTASSRSLPGGKANYVVSVIGGQVNATGVRLATYAFRPDGRVVQEYWAWRQDRISGKGNAGWAKPASGYRTTGCLHNCPIRTPAGFQSGRRGTVITGRWSAVGNRLTIRWGPLGTPERWTLDTGIAGVAGATLVSSHPQVRGWALGSNAALTRAVGIRGIYDAQRFYGPMAMNKYGSPTTMTRIGFAYQDYRPCSNGLCLQGRYVTAANKRTWFSSYWAANPARDGRKVFWNNQTGTVQQLEQPGSACISAGGGGHTDALLQALDDSGRIVGLVGVEASLNQRKPGQAVVGAFAMALPTHSSLVL